jgi:hypothetical protein
MKDRTGAERKPATAGPAGNDSGALLAPNRDGGGPAGAAPSEWPFQSYLELGALPGAVPCARLHVRQMLWEWRLHALTDPAELIVSELVTNGLRASEVLPGSRYAAPGVSGIPALRMWLHGDRARIAVQVWDGNDQLPIRQATEPEAESGRGLMLVEALSEAWGSYKPQQSSGKVVWAILS